MKRKNILLAVAAVVLVLCASIAPAWSYFTAYSEANGTLEIKIKPTTVIEEEYKGHTKKVVIHNLADSDVSVCVRARAYFPNKKMVSEQGELEFSVTPSGDNWTGPEEDGWLYFGSIDTPIVVDPNEHTTPLEFNIDFPKNYKPEEGENYSVIILYESTPVKYRTNGTPYADWSISKNHKTEGGVVFDD